MVLISGAKVSFLKCDSYLVLNILEIEHAESFKSFQIMVSFSGGRSLVNSSRLTLAQEK